MECAKQQLQNALKLFGFAQILTVTNTCRQSNTHTHRALFAQETSLDVSVESYLGKFIPIELNTTHLIRTWYVWVKVNYVLASSRFPRIQWYFLTAPQKGTVLVPTLVLVLTLILCHQQNSSLIYVQHCNRMPTDIPGSTLPACIDPKHSWKMAYFRKWKKTQCININFANTQNVRFGFIEFSIFSPEHIRTVWLKAFLMELVAIQKSYKDRVRMGLGTFWFTSLSMIRNK